MLLYNIDFEIVALIFVCAIYIFHRANYTVTNILNRQFRFIEIGTIIFIATDILSAICISYYMYIPPFLNSVINSSNFCSLVIIAYIFCKYIYTLALKADDWPKMPICTSLLVIYMVAAVLNLFLGFLFYFDETGYIHGPLYLMSPATAYIMVLISAYILLRYRKNLSRKQIISAASYVILILVAAIVQLFIVPSMLFSGVAVGVVHIIILFSLETPDYARLQLTMKELESAKEEAERANKSKSDFLANMSHEIRTPLNGILGINEILMMENRDKTLNHYFNDIKESGNTLLSIINDILDTSKIESGKLEIIDTPYNLNDMLHVCHSVVEQRADNKKLQLVFEIDPTLPSVLNGDEIRIRQVITNLLTNAVKYTDSGYVKLSVTGSKAGDDSIEIKISVKDSGIGIRNEDIGKLFGSFERLELKRNRSIEGTGLGLKMVHNLTELMHGHVEVVSEYGVGSTFTVTLPQGIVDAKPVGEYVTTSSNDVIEIEELPALGNRHVLVVDDVEINLRVIKGLLKDTPLTIDTTTSGAKAIEMCMTNKYDLILMDHMMPEMDGIEAMNGIKSTCPLNVDTPIIVLTANAVAGAKEEYLEVGFADYLSKPVSKKDLQSKLALY